MERNIRIRGYKSADCEAMAKLFYDTVHTVNARDYTQAQRNAWATGSVDLKSWDASFLRHKTLVAEKDGEILGFGDMAEDGYLDRLYVHKDWQGQGIATAICDALEDTVKGTVTTHASITAKPFFEGRGYVTRREQQVERHGVRLTNYIMEKL